MLLSNRPTSTTLFVHVSVEYHITAQCSEGIGIQIHKVNFRSEVAE
jgi:hypothetical protein